MSDTNPTPSNNPTEGDGKPDARPTDPAPKPTPPPEDGKTADSTDWVAEAKKWERRAKENVEKARRLDEMEAANKTEAQRLTDALNAAQKQAETAQQEALRYRIAAKHNITDADAELFLTGTDADTLERQAARLAEQVTQARPPRGYVPAEGKAPATPLNSTGLEDAIKNKLGIT